MTKSANKLWALANAFVLLLVIYWNYYANAQGINENSVGSLSAEYDNLFTPSSYAFSIWGLIYIALTINAAFQVRAAFKNINTSFFKPLGPFLMVANIGNALWIWLWLTERTGLSVITMLVILVCLLTAVIRLGIKSGDRSPAAIKRWVWWPISLYAGWITVATVANISAYLAKINWSLWLTEVNWAITMIIIAAIVYLFVLIKRGMITFSLVGVWAFAAIAHKQWGMIPGLAWVAAASAAIIFIFAIVTKVKDLPLKSA
jgi:hypothetical protein